jgi:3,4-dihydroxy 2-butanone 4-phosphate synthase / GTP cyclohydrolase II
MGCGRLATAWAPRMSDFSSPQTLIAEARNGRMVILVDDENRENEGDIVLPAQFATPEKINFMATHARGLICLALETARVEQLGLPLMSNANQSRHQTAFTISIEAREGVTTGISAADRARTIAAAIDNARGADAIVSPGHLFPLVARPGGVLVRAGHTEAAVDLARLAGLNPAGVICEIMCDDGRMARLPHLVPFAHEHGLKIGTIRDLIAYRRKHDHFVEHVAEQEIESRWGGRWLAKVYRDRISGSEQIALLKGMPKPNQPTLVRVHRINPFADVFGEVLAGRDLLARSMELIAREGAGILLTVNRTDTGAFSKFVDGRDRRLPADSDYWLELRDYGVGAQILADLGVEKMVLLTDNELTPVALEGYGLEVVGRRSTGALSS